MHYQSNKRKAIQRRHKEGGSQAGAGFWTILCCFHLSCLARHHFHFRGSPLKENTSMVSVQRPCARRPSLPQYSAFKEERLLRDRVSQHLPCCCLRPPPLDQSRRSHDLSYLCPHAMPIGILCHGLLSPLQNLCCPAAFLPSVSSGLYCRPKDCTFIYRLLVPLQLVLCLATLLSLTSVYTMGFLAPNVLFVTKWSYSSHLHQLCPCGLSFLLSVPTSLCLFSCLLLLRFLTAADSIMPCPSPDGSIHYPVSRFFPHALFGSK